MKERLDLVRQWIRKAGSDLTAVRLAVDAGTALDTACFHAQQAAEKFLKAYLIFAEIEFPYTHSLSKLLELCESKDRAFHSLASQVEPLTPYAAELRYDDEFWPSQETAMEAQAAADAVRTFVLARFPADVRGTNTGEFSAA